MTKTKTRSSDKNIDKQKANKEKKGSTDREAKIFQQRVLERVAIHVQNRGRGEGYSLSKPLHLHPKFNSK